MKTLILLNVAMLALLITAICFPPTEVRVLHPDLTYQVVSVSAEEALCASEYFHCWPWGKVRAVARIDRNLHMGLEMGTYFQVSKVITPRTSNPNQYISYVQAPTTAQ